MEHMGISTNGGTLEWMIYVYIYIYIYMYIYICYIHSGKSYIIHIYGPECNSHIKCFSSTSLRRLTLQDLRRLLPGESHGKSPFMGKITMFHGENGENHHVSWRKLGKSPWFMGKSRINHYKTNITTERSRISGKDPPFLKWENVHQQNISYGQLPHEWVFTMLSS